MLAGFPGIAAGDQRVAPTLIRDIIMDSVFLNSFQNQTSNARYRWPAVLAVLLHILLGGLLLGHFLTDPSTTYTQNQQVVQANLVSSSALSSMMAKAAHPQPTQPPVKPKPPTPTPIVPTPTLTPAPEKPTIKERPVYQKTPVPTQATVKIKPLPQHRPKPVVSKPVQQKSLEEDLLQAELNKSETATKPKKTDTAAQEELMSKQLQSEAKTSGAQTSSKQSAATQGEIDQYKALILQQIQQNWIMPQNIADLSCVLQIALAPGGMVLNVTLSKSSGNAALDRSAIAAVNKASPLPVPKDSAAFAAFRNFTLTVKPDGSEMT